MHLQVLNMSRTPLICEENVKKMTVFLTILKMLILSWIINEIYINILIFVHGWTHNAPRIPKMYNITGIWWTGQTLLTAKPIATLRYPKWNEMKQEALRRSRYMTTTWLTDQMLKILSLPDWLNDKLLNIMSLIGVINEVYVNILIFLYSWTDNARSIPQMYNFICIWWIRPKLLTHSKFVLGEIKWMYDNNICIPLLYKTHH